jgi:hypothetical protein
VKWDKGEWNKHFIPLFEYFKREKNKIEGMWGYEMEFILFYSIPLRSIPLFFFKSEQWKIILFHFAPLHSVIFHQSKQKVPFNKVFTFAITLIYSRVLQIYQNNFIRYLDSGYTKKNSTIIIFYNTHYLNSKRVKRKRCKMH